MDDFGAPMQVRARVEEGSRNFTLLSKKLC